MRLLYQPLRAAVVLSLAVATPLFPALPAKAEPPRLIPRETLFGAPQRTSPQLSPDGKRLAWLAPDDQGVLQVWVQTVGKTDVRQLTKGGKRPIRGYLWAENNRDLLYLQDQDGDENFHLYGVDLASGQGRDLTPFPGVRADIVALAPQLPEQMLITLNQRNPQLFDVYRLDLTTGKLVLDTENPGDVGQFIADTRLQVRGAQVMTPDGGTELRLRQAAQAPWRAWKKVGPTEILEFEAFTGDGKSAVLKSSVGSNTARIVREDLATGKQTIVAASPVVDAGSLLLQPETNKVQAVSFAPGRRTWQVVDPAVKADLAGIAKLFPGDFAVADRTRADDTWLVGFTSDQASSRYYVWDRKTHKGTLLFAAKPELDTMPLASMQPVTIKSRDGLDLHSYLTLPVGVPAKQLPLVLLVHGGPWARDFWHLDPMVQLLANRGYAVLQVNFRGSTGYGKAFLNAGNRQWGLKMHDDLIDAVDWAVTKGIADKKRISIMGGSYGGYATLAGLAFTPEVFACGVDIVGPSNLITLLRAIPPYWATQKAEFDLRMGKVDDPKDEALLRHASPLFRAEQIQAPLLIAQGANDPRVKQDEAEQIVAAIRRNHGQVVYVLYSDEGHGFARPVNNIDFTARTEAFLAKYLGGRCEPLTGERYPGSTAVVQSYGFEQ